MANSLEPTKKTATMTDSGITHTIPNNSIVTVTKRTTITTQRPTPTASNTVNSVSDDITLRATGPGTSESTPKPTLTEVGIGEDAYSGSGSNSLSTGPIVSIAIGGAILIAVLVFLICALLRRKKDNLQSKYGSRFNGHRERDDVVEEKHVPQPVSTQTTGNPGSCDPFAPFGGRADQSEELYRRSSGTFELDGTSAAPAELPAIRAPGPVHMVISAEPRANLNFLQTESCSPVCVNNGNQYGGED